MGAEYVSVMDVVFPVGEHVPAAEMIVTAEFPVTLKSEPSGEMEEHNMLSAKVMVTVVGAQGCVGIVPMGIGACGVMLKIEALDAGIILPHVPTSVLPSAPFTTSSE